jgi:hypothetical protein
MRRTFSCVSRSASVVPSASYALLVYVAFVVALLTAARGRRASWDAAASYRRGGATSSRLGSTPSREGVSSRGVAVVGEDIVDEVPPPPAGGWSWLRVSPKEAKIRGIPAGRYATPATNQHRSGWCGACYLVAVVQMIADRWSMVANFAVTASDHTATPCVSMDMLSILCDYDRYHSEELSKRAGGGRAATPPSWNGCQGGSPMSVLQCMMDGRCPLRESPSDGDVWTGYVGDAAAEHGAPTSRMTVVEKYFVPNDPKAVREELYRHGPVVLLIDAETLLETDTRGVARGRPASTPNHAVSVVGWQRAVDGRMCWVVRNSWGSVVPDNLPKDRSCVTRSTNRCTPNVRSWRSIPEHPGFCLLPFSYLDGRNWHGTSPWLACRLGLRSV